MTILLVYRPDGTIDRWENRSVSPWSDSHLFIQHTVCTVGHITVGHLWWKREVETQDFRNVTVACYAAGAWEKWEKWEEE